jgi:hypothetical protein
MTLTKTLGKWKRVAYTLAHSAAPEHNVCFQVDALWNSADRHLCRVCILSRAMHIAQLSNLHAPHRRVKTHWQVSSTHCHVT